MPIVARTAAKSRDCAVKSTAIEAVETAVTVLATHDDPTVQRIARWLASLPAEPAD
jgi:hypothetical protein